MGSDITKYDERFAEMAKAYAQGEHVGGDFLSTRGGVLTFNDEPLPGNQMCVIILDVVMERTYYTHAYDSDGENLPPVCYAFARPGDTDEMAPHLETMQVAKEYFTPQNDICRTCPHNEWGSADVGRGKACKERRRLALLPAGYYQPKRGSRDFDLHVFEDPEHYEAADIAYLKLPVTSVKDYARYVTDLASRLRRPPLAVITRVYVEPDPNSQFRVKFEQIAEIPPELYDAVMLRHDEARAGIIFGYPPPSGEVRPKKVRR